MPSTNYRPLGKRFAPWAVAATSNPQHSWLPCILDSCRQANHRRKHGEAILRNHGVAGRWSAPKAGAPIADETVSASVMATPANRESCSCSKTNPDPLKALTFWRAYCPVDPTRPGSHLGKYARMTIYSCRGVAQPGSAPALGARYFILCIPFPAVVSILFNKLGNLLLVQSYLQWPQPRSQMHGSGTAAHLLLSGF